MTEQKKNVVTENKMGVMPVNKLLISMSLPMMISMLVQALYNIVDSIFVAKINEDALTAVSLAFPMQTLMIALAGGTCVGVNAMLSKALGEKNYNKVNLIAVNGVFLAALSCLLFIFIGIFGVRLFYESQTDDVVIVEYGVQYLTIVCTCSAGVFSQFVFEKLLQSTGKTFLTMITQTTGAVINLILDPIMIFGLFGFPKMGVAGAALATVIGQIIAGIFAFILNQKFNHEVQLRFKGFRPSLSVIKSIYVVGVPSIIMQSIGSIMVYGMNQILIAFSSTATAVFGIYYKLQSFVFMPVFGLNNGMVPIIAYNYGARNKERLTKTIKLAIMYGVCIMGIGLFVFQLIPDKLCLLFEASDHMLSMGVPALRTISLSFIFAGFCIVGSSTFQAFGNAVYSMIMSICRQMLVLLPVAYFLSKFGNVNLVWWAFPIAELMSFALTVVFLIRINKNILSRL